MKLHFVRKARKPRPKEGIRKGESYYWWQPKVTRTGLNPVIRSKTKPKKSQLTRSDYLKSFYLIKEGTDDTIESLEQAAADLRELASEQRSKYDSMPSGPQQGPTGELLQDRADACDALAGEIETAIVGPSECIDAINWSQADI